MERITSIKNDRIKKWRKLATKKGREASGSYLVEGIHLIEEAILAKQTIKALIVRDETKIPTNWNVDMLAKYGVTPQVADALAETNSTQGLFAEIEMIESNSDIDAMNFVLIMDEVQDPGNIGTIIRTADAAGYDTVVLGKGSGDIYNPKIVRATQGSLYHINVVAGVDLTEFIPALQEQEVPVFGAVLDAEAKRHYQIDPLERVALVVGNEAQGINAEIIEKLDEKVYIPIYGKAESLNVGVATGILAYHLADHNDREKV